MFMNLLCFCIQAKRQRVKNESTTQRRNVEEKKLKVKSWFKFFYLPQCAMAMHAPDTEWQTQPVKSACSSSTLRAT